MNKLISCYRLKQLSFLSAHAFVLSALKRRRYLRGTVLILRHASGCQNAEEIIHVILAEMRSVRACQPCHAFMVSTQGSLIAIILCKGFIRCGQNIKHVSQHVRLGECEHSGMMLRLLSSVCCLSKPSINIALPQIMRNSMSLLH